LKTIGALFIEIEGLPLKKASGKKEKEKVGVYFCHLRTPLAGKY
jgi:hypothetical protein